MLRENAGNGCGEVFAEMACARQIAARSADCTYQDWPVSPTTRQFVSCCLQYTTFFSEALVALHRYSQHGRRWRLRDVEGLLGGGPAVPREKRRDLQLCSPMHRMREESFPLERDSSVRAHNSCGQVFRWPSGLDQDIAHRRLCALQSRLRTKTC